MHQLAVLVQLAHDSNALLVAFEQFVELQRHCAQLGCRSSMLAQERHDQHVLAQLHGLGTRDAMLAQFVQMQPLLLGPDLDQLARVALVDLVAEALVVANVRVAVLELVQGRAVDLDGQLAAVGILCIVDVGLLARADDTRDRVEHLRVQKLVQDQARACVHHGIGCGKVLRIANADAAAARYCIRYKWCVCVCVWRLLYCLLYTD
jgi:hypothetical protein